MTTPKSKTRPPRLRAETVLILRTCAADMTAHGGFKWPRRGPVSAPDWDPAPVCGHGLHGFLWGGGDVSLASSASDAIWLVVRAVAQDVVDLGSKVKFPRGVVVYAGDRASAVAMIQAAAPSSADPCMYGTATSGDYGTATAGDSGTATAGVRGTATAGDSGTARILWWDGSAGRYRTTVFYPGESGIEANKPYRLNPITHLPELVGAS